MKQRGIKKAEMIPEMHGKEIRRLLRLVSRMALQKDKITARMLLTAKAVAAMTGLSRETLAQWRSQKRGISYLKIGRAVRYDPSEVQAYLERCRVSVSDPRKRRRK